MTQPTNRAGVRPWPEAPRQGMQTGKIPSGVKVTDAETGRFYCCNSYRSQHKNRDTAIEILKAMDDAAFAVHEA